MEIRHRTYCSRCWKDKPEVKTYFCKKGKIQYYRCNECNTESARKYRTTEKGRANINKAIKKSTEKHQFKQDARLKVQRAIKSKRLIKPNKCEICKEIKILEGHHMNYSKPLKVTWLCKQCHSNLHHH